MTATVLIVEDDALNLRYFNDVLRSEGYRTRTARTGAAAIEEARAERPDLILMDMELAGACGLAVASALRADAALARVPVIALTAHAMRGDEERFRREGCDGYIAKPVTMKGFLDAVRRYCPS